MQNGNGRRAGRKPGGKVTNYIYSMLSMIMAIIIMISMYLTRKADLSAQNAGKE